ncbi:MAG TPA: DUF721 domain-containing protein [Desulfobacteraceae bacterium]|nr:DUF721 domain-containing protein [Desulfobacteraceae bacterium]
MTLEYSNNMNNKAALPDLASQLEGLYGRKNWRTLWQIYTLDRNWDKIAGGEIARQSRPAYIQNNILWIFVSSSVWMHHLQSIKPRLLAGVRNALPEVSVDDIRWILQPLEPLIPDNPSRRPPERIPDPEKIRHFEQMASTVENSECRAALCKLWRAYQKFR